MRHIIPPMTWVELPDGVNVLYDGDNNAWVETHPDGTLTLSRAGRWRIYVDPDTQEGQPHDPH